MFTCLFFFLLLWFTWFSAITFVCLFPGLFMLLIIMPFPPSLSKLAEVVLARLVFKRSTKAMVDLSCVFSQTFKDVLASLCYQYYRDV